MRPDCRVVVTMPNNDFQDMGPPCGGVDRGSFRVLDLIADTVASELWVYGTSDGDKIGSGTVTVLSNTSVVVGNPHSSVGVFTENGEVGLVPPVPGLQKVQTGAASFDHFGNGDIVELFNTDIVLAHPEANGLAGYIIHVTSSWVIRLHVSGAAGELYGSGGIVALNSGNYAFASPQADGGRGVVWLVDGPLAALIESVNGTFVDDALGSSM